MRDMTLAYARLAAQVEPVALVAQGGVVPPNMTWAPSTIPSDPPFTFYYTLELDVGGDPFPDIVLDGRASFEEDPSDGIALNSCVMIDNDIAPVQDASVSIWGWNWIMAEFVADNRIEVDGPASWDNVLERCSAEMSADENDPLVVVFPTAIVNPGQPQVAAEFGPYDVYGGFDRMDVDYRSERFRGTASIDSGSQDGIYVGSSAQYTIRLFPSRSDLDGLTNCLRNQQEAFTALSGVVEKLTDLFIQGGRELQTIPDADGLTITSSGDPRVVNYSIDLDTFTNGQLAGTQTGQLSKYRDTGPGPNRFTTLQISYRIDAAQVLPNGPNFSGRNGLEVPWRAAIDPSDEYRYFGTGSIDFAGCPTTWAVEEATALEPDAGETRDGPHQEGTNDVALLVTPDSLSSELRYTDAGTYAFRIMVNGYEIPSTGIDQPIND